MPTFSDSRSPVSAALDAAENRLGVTLPPDFKQFLLTTNGGCPEPQEFVVPDRGPALAGISDVSLTEPTSGGRTQHVFGLRQPSGSSELMEFLKESDAAVRALAEKDGKTRDKIPEHKKWISAKQAEMKK